MDLRDHYNYLAGAQLSPHFTAFEFVNSSHYPELVVVPDVVFFRKGADFANEVLENYRAYCCDAKPVKVDSWYRNPMLNGRVGGVDDSVHQIFYPDASVFIGVAADTVPTGVSIYKAFSRLADPAILSKMPSLRTVILYPNRGFIHIDSRRSRKTVLFEVSVTKGKYEVVSQAEARNIVATMKQRFKLDVSL